MCGFQARIIWASSGPTHMLRRCRRRAVLAYDNMPSYLCMHMSATDITVEVSLPKLRRLTASWCGA